MFPYYIGTRQRIVCKYHPPAGYLYEPHKITLADNCTCTLEEVQARQVKILERQKFLTEHYGLLNEPHLLGILHQFYKEPKIGYYMGGGVVFYVDKVKRRALISAIRDIGLCKWGPMPYQEIISIDSSCFGIGNSGFEKPRLSKSPQPSKVTEKELFSGLGNTERLCVLKNPFPFYDDGYAAALATKGYREGGYADWHLPSLDELSAMYQQRAIINAAAIQKGGTVFAESGADWGQYSYWSSSEAGSKNAWLFGFDSGFPSNTEKDVRLSVRPIRAFSF